MRKGLAIGTGIHTVERNTYTRGNRQITQISFKNRDGSTAGSISMSKTIEKKKKRLQYNFKQISSMLLLTKTSGSASRVVTKARANVAMLLKKVRNGDYDEKELESAIAHARKLERIAKKRVKHLKEEEKAQAQGSCVDFEELDENGETEENDSEREQEFTQEELKKMMEESRRLMEETMAELEEAANLDDLADSIMATAYHDMDREDIERLKKKHRADEMREIVEADMKYLKDLFARLEREKQETSGSSARSAGVSLELYGNEMPVPVSETPVPAEGGNVDLSV